VALGAENAESARYKELKEDKFYLPNDWLEYGEKGEFWHNELKAQSEKLNKMYHNCLNDLIQAGMPKARAKESARFFKMYNSQLNSNKIMSFDGFMQIYKKRNLLSPSQKEIGDVLEQMLNEIKSIPDNPFKDSLKAFGV
jgi:superfamily II RNA helicase